MPSKANKFKIQLLWKNGKRCGICGKKIRRVDELTVDHIVPLAKGGGNVIENCQLAHQKCNAEKGNILPDVYERIMKYNKRKKLKNRVCRIFVFWHA